MKKLYFKIILGVVGFFIIASISYGVALADRMVPHTWIGTVPVGGLTREQATERLATAIAQFGQEGLPIHIDGAPEIIHPDEHLLSLDTDATIERAFERGHGDSALANTWQSITALVHAVHIDAVVALDSDQLALQLNQVVASHESARQDVRLQVKGTTVTLLTDTKPGRVIDRSSATAQITRALASLDTTPISLTLHDVTPVADPAVAPSALADARTMMSRALTLQYEDSYFTISRSRIGTWIISTYQGSQLVASISRPLVTHYVATIAKALNVDSIPAQVTTESGRIVGIVPPRVGQAVQESKLADMISASLAARTNADKAGDTLVIPMTITRPSLTGVDLGAGITELIGKAVTTFTGSPHNRISNIKNGVKFISGTIIQPGQEFSTLATLGTVDATTGYLPELVIKGTRTVPDFGGGLCQVSTTLFRAVLNSALPISARRNHSYRVSYYEKDGNGAFIGPGLDATIYEPDLDFKFRNDMSTPILIIGTVVGDKVTFELYGTKDGRTSHIDGPTKLSETPPGDTKYLPTDRLPAGAKKQVETAHPGGTATATYTITYPDGHKATQVFNSRYRPWPAQYLIGTNSKCSTAAQCASIMDALLPPGATPEPIY